MPEDPTSTQPRPLHPAYGFGMGRGIETDEPLPFRRETFAADLDDHARLVDRFLEAGAFEGREVLSIPRCGEILAGIVSRGSNGEIGYWFPFRCDAVRMTDKYRGVTREPEVERGRGPGLRKSVVEAIAASRSSCDSTAVEPQRAL
jgi:hypothetical protein